MDVSNKPKSKPMGCLDKLFVYTLIAFAVLMSTCVASMNQPSKHEQQQAWLEQERAAADAAKAESAADSEAEKALGESTEEEDPLEPESPWASYTPPGPVAAVLATRDTSVLATPGGSSLGTLRKGAAVKLEERSGDYYEIVLFSGEYRYVRAADCKSEKVAAKVPSEQKSRSVFARICEAEDKANRESDQVLAVDIKAGAQLQRELVDKYKLEAAQQAGVSPLVADEVSMLGVLEKWPPLY